MLLTWQWILALLAAYVAGLSKTGVAGLGILAVALFASALPARDSLGVVLMVLIAADLVAVASYRREVEWRQLLRLFPWAALGVVLGALAMRRIDEALFRPLIGGTLALLVSLALVRRYRTRGAAPAAPTTPRRAVTILTGLSAGFTTMVANASGPIMVIYLLGMRLPKMLFIGTSAWFFFALNLYKVPFSYGLGLINPQSLPLGLMLAPLAILGAISGRLIIGRIDQQLFETLALVLTLLAGLRLLFL